MLIIDFSAISVAAVFSQNPNDLSEDLLRHIVLSSIRMYRNKFKEFCKDPTDVYIACDHHSWRKRTHPFYKAARKKGRDDSPFDWNEVFQWIGNIRQELEEYSPYRIVQVEGAEADDIIAQLVFEQQEFGGQAVMIISSDKDFKQLQRYGNVHQFSPNLKKKLVEKDANRYLFEHIIRGDGGDGVPNVLSNDDVFLTDQRQSPITKKKLEAWWNEYVSTGTVDIGSPKLNANFTRNKTLVDLRETPEDVVNDITSTLETVRGYPTPPAMKFMNYLVKKRCKQLIGSVQEFY